MKLKDNLVLRQVADTWCVLAYGEALVDFNGMLTLNESGVLLWKALEEGKDREGLVEALTGEYEVSEEQASADVDAFLDKLSQAGCLKNE